MTVDLHAPAQPPRHVLVVEDSPEVRRSMERLLGRLGYSTRSAEDGIAGLEALAQKVPDAVLCDLRMPRLDGIAFLGRVRERWPDLPVIVMSGEGRFEDAVAALKLGAWDYVEKPILELAVLEHALSRAMEKAALLAENRRYRKSLEEANRQLATSLRMLSDDQTAGRMLQFSMLPRNHQRFGDYEVSRQLVPSAVLSGDFIDVFSIDAAHWGFYLADVAGHGVSSALVTMLLRTFVQLHVADHARTGSRLIFSPAGMLERLNGELARAGLDRHLTIFFGVVDSVTDELRFANAGHFPGPMLFDGVKTVVLDGPGLPVGVMPNAQYEDHEIHLPRPLVLSVFSDGLLELLPHASLERKEAFLRLLFGRASVTVESVCKELKLDPPPSLADDIAILIIKRGETHA